MQRLLLNGLGLWFALGTLLNGATLRFDKPSTYNLGAGASSVALGDLNNDGSPDVVAPNVYAGTVSILLNDGFGGFVFGTNIPSATFGPWSALIADFNGDGTNDVAVNGLYGSRRVTLLLNDGSGAGFTEVGTGVPAPFSFIAIDLNHDERPDLIGANYSGGSVDIALGQPSGGFARVRPFDVGRYSRPFAVASADFNRDGFIDVVAVNNGEQTAKILFGDGHGSFPAVTNIPLPESPTWVAVGDLDEDGCPDALIVQWGSYTIIRISDDGMVETRNRSFDCVGAVLADIDCDGHLDFVTLTGGGCGVMRGTGRGKFHRARIFDAPRAALDNLGKATIAVDDLDRDGKPDVVVLNDDDTFSVLLNRTPTRGKPVRHIAVRGR
jgi:hypothetical protein